IYTDVDGVFTADPRHVPEAVKLDSIGYEEMLELASLGAGVLHCRAAIFAQKYNVPLHIRHSQKPQSGTLVMKDPLDQSSLESVSVVGCALTNDLVMISLHGLPNAMHPSDAGLNDSPQAIIFRHAADAGVFIDDIMQTEDGRKANISFTAPREGLEALKRAVECALDVIGEGDLAVRTGLAKVSAVGVGMRSHTGVASTMFNALAEAGIGIRTITTSEIKISCIVDESESAEALRVVHRAFGLETRGQSCADTKSASLMPHVEVKTNLGKTMSS
ncbi:MAG: ACT domain-containing protein, partial [Planctomycetota bacterium]|nr:ACT domain-containing protein [Planctomycetota bacterium]